MFRWRQEATRKASTQELAQKDPRLEARPWVRRQFVQGAPFHVGRKREACFADCPAKCASPHRTANRKGKVGSLCAQCLRIDDIQHGGEEMLCDVVARERRKAKGDLSSSSSM